MARTIREIINAVKNHKRLQPGEAWKLATLLDVHWQEKCSRCRSSWPVDHLDERGGICEECSEQLEAGASP